MTFNELSSFTRRVIALMDDESYAKLQITLHEKPDAGKIIKGSGGLRKIRWAAKGRGKSGGFRVITYYPGADRVYLIDAFAKTDKANLTKAERNDLASLVGVLVEI